MNTRINCLLISVFIGSFFLNGCTYSPKKADEYPTIVDIDDQVNHDRPQIHQDSSSYGPFTDSDDFDQAKPRKTVREPILGVVLGPGLYRSVAHISFLRALEKTNITVHAVSGIGFGSIIAALYAAGRTPDEIEWRFFKFFSKMKSVEPFSEKWFEGVNQVLISELKGKRVQELKKGLILLSPKANGQDFKLIKTGDLYQLIIENIQSIRTHPTGDFFLGRQEDKGHYMIEALGVDILMIVDALGDEIKLSNNDDYLMGLFGKISSQISRRQNLFQHFFELPTQEMAIDSTNDLTLIMKRSYEKSFSYAEEILNTIEEWKNMKGKP